MGNKGWEHSCLISVHSHASVRSGRPKLPAMVVDIVNLPKSRVIEEMSL